MGRGVWGWGGGSTLQYISNKIISFPNTPGIRWLAASHGSFWVMAQFSIKHFNLKSRFLFSFFSFSLPPSAPTTNPPTGSTRQSALCMSTVLQVSAKFRERTKRRWRVLEVKNSLGQKLITQLFRGLVKLQQQVYALSQLLGARLQQPDQTWWPQWSVCTMNSKPCLKHVCDINADM